MAELQFYITEVGRTALAQAASAGDALTLTGLVLTDSETTGSLGTIEDLASLSGTVVFDGAVAGGVIADATVQFEAFDMSEAAYEAHTVALYFDDGTGTKVFAVASSADVVVYKTEFTSASAVFVMTIDETDAMTLTFANTTISVPPATKELLGVVKLCQDGDIHANAPNPDDEPGMPTVATPHAVTNGFKHVLGAHCFAGTLQAKESLRVGVLTHTFYHSGWQAVEGATNVYEQSLGEDYILDQIKGCYGTVNAIDVRSVTYTDGGQVRVMLISADNEVLAGIVQTSDGWMLQAKSADDETLPVVGLWLRTRGDAELLSVETTLLEAKSVSVGTGLTAGHKGFMPIQRDLWIKSPRWSYFGVPVQLVGGLLVDKPYLLVDGVRFEAEKFDNLLTFGDSGYSIDTETGTLHYGNMDGEPSANLMLWCTYPVTISATDAVKAYGHDIMRAHGCLGWVKFAWSPTTGVLSVFNGYQMTISMHDSSSGSAYLRVSYSTPTGAADLRSVVKYGEEVTNMLMFETMASAKVLGSENHTDRVFQTEYYDTATIYFDKTKTFTGIVRVF